MGLRRGAGNGPPADVERRIGPWHHGGALGALIHYDLTILRRSAAAAFARKRDILLLILVIPVGLMLVIARMSDGAALLIALPNPLKLGLAILLALALNIAVGRRLAHLREDSLVARRALQPRQAVAHAAFWNVLPAASLLLLLIGATDPASLAVALSLAYLTGVALAAACESGQALLRSHRARPRKDRRGRRAPQGATRRGRIVALLAGRAGLFGPRFAANLLGFLAIGAMLGAAQSLLALIVSTPAAWSMAGLPLLVLLLALLRTQPASLRFLLALGSNPLLPGLVATALAVSLVGGFLAAALLTNAAPALTLLAGGAVVLLLFAALSLLSSLHFATKRRHDAEMAMQVDLVAAAIVGFIALPLAPLFLATRLWLLARRADTMRHLLP